MGVSSFLQSVYDLETLDTRFTTASNTPYKTVIDARTDPSSSKDRASKFRDQVKPSKWNTPEFYLYYLVFIVVLPYMFWTAYDASRPSNPHWYSFEPYLSEGWIPGRKIDASDSQYRTFRNNLPYMAALLVFHPLARRLYNTIVYPVPSKSRDSRPTLEEADERLNQRATFDFGFALIFLTALHGISVLKVLTILFLNYQIATTIPRKYVPLATWVFNIGILFANDIGKGYKFAYLAGFLDGPSQHSVNAAESGLVAFGRWLDGYGGIMSRWEILFNITVLRLISFNMDYYWSLDRRSYSPLEKQVDPASQSERERVNTPAQARDYTFRNYVAYAIYAPLYLTGPIITFNDYISQLRYQPATIETPRTLRYGVRFIMCLLAMEVALHFDYVQAIAKSNPPWSEYPTGQLAVLSYMNLIFIWLKLLLPWRLFRLWALVDGIDPPENMLRCVSNNYSPQMFWRAWHRSYNRWLIRYIWVPLGGSDFRNFMSATRSVLTYGVAFTFVALWHDIQLRLLVWGWLIVLFMIPEMIARLLFPAKQWERYPTAYRMLCCAGAVGNILMMMMANLVGFAFGLDGLHAILNSMFKDFSGFMLILGACSALFVGVQVMFEYREAELRRGISLKC